MTHPNTPSTVIDATASHFAERMKDRRMVATAEELTDLRQGPHGIHGGDDAHSPLSDSDQMHLAALPDDIFPSIAGQPRHVGNEAPCLRLPI
jgi:hypothetical protein